jgi:hypothetical protein
LASAPDTLVFLQQGTLGRLFVRDGLAPAATGAGSGAPRDAVTLLEPDGRKLWTVPVWPGAEPALLTAPPLPMPDGGVILCTDRGLARVDVAGTHRWKLDAAPCSAVIRGRHQPIVAVARGAVLALDPEGAVTWRYPTALPAAIDVLVDGSVVVATRGAARGLDGFGKPFWELSDPLLEPRLVGATDRGVFVAVRRPAPAGGLDPTPASVTAAATPASGSLPGEAAAVPPPATVTGAVRLLPPAAGASAPPARRDVTAPGAPALPMPDGLAGLEDGATLYAVGPDGALRWRALCASPALVVFGEIVCAAGTSARVYRADGKLLADVLFPGGVVMAAVATPEWVHAVVRSASGAATLRGAPRPPAP